MYSLVRNVFTIDRLEHDGGKEEQDGEELDGQFEEGEKLEGIALGQLGGLFGMVVWGGKKSIAPTTKASSPADANT